MKKNLFLACLPLAALAALLAHLARKWRDYYAV